MVATDAKAVVENGYVPIEGGSLYFEACGQGPSLVFAHGLGGNYRSWWQQMPAFAGSFRCISFSHRGFLPSRDFATGAPQPHFFARDLAQLLDHLGIDSTTLVAQSMGGWTAMEFALAAPERVSALVLAGSTGTLEADGLTTLATSTADPHNIALRARDISPAAGERMAREQPALYSRYKEIDRASGDWDRAIVRQSLDSMRTRTPASLATITAPCLAIVGAEDRTCPPHNIEILATTLLKPKMIVVSETGHSVYFERADIFNALVLDFLSASKGRA